MKSSVLSPSFLGGSTGHLFSLFYRPGEETAPEHFILFFPPFTEELNKSRRMISLQARKFAAMGYGVLVVDYYGTGDSEGQFSEATWDIWQRDLSIIATWLEEQGAQHITLWGLRFGALLAMHSIPLFQEKLSRILLWQPVIRGELMMSQFLRLRLAADMIGAGNAAGGGNVTVRDLREQLANGNSVEVAGYELTPNLVAGIDGLNLLNLGASDLPPVEWFEVVSSVEQSISPVSQKVLDAWGESGMQVNTQTVVGQAFWTTPEITILPALLEKTTDTLQEGRS